MESGKNKMGFITYLIVNLIKNLIFNYSMLQDHMTESAAEEHVKLNLKH